MIVLCRVESRKLYIEIMKLIPFFLFGIVFFLSSCQKTHLTVDDRVNTRTYPSVFQAWYSVDMPDVYPTNTEEQRIKVSAMHDLMWEEPLSQLGEGVDLVLGLEWAHENNGLASSFTEESFDRAKRNKIALLEENPNMVCLFEVRWRDAPQSFLPEDSEWWLRDTSGQIVKGWLGGWEPFLMLNYDNPEFQDNVARQCRLVVESGVYDGVMFDWSGHLEIIKKVRKAIGPDKLIIVNVHDDVHDGELFRDYINGSFMELNPIDTLSIPVDDLVLYGKEDVNKRNWDKMRDALLYFENNFLEPQINCLEVWGNRDDLARMRATTTLGLVYSDGYVLYADPNPLSTPDHNHDWYNMWDYNLGKPLAKYVQREDGLALREYDNGTVVYNHYGNPKLTITFESERTRLSDKTKGKVFIVNGRDGDIFIN